MHGLCHFLCLIVACMHALTQFLAGMWLLGFARVCLHAGGSWGLPACMWLLGFACMHVAPGICLHACGSWGLLWLRRRLHNPAVYFPLDDPVMTHIDMSLS